MPDNLFPTQLEYLIESGVLNRSENDIAEKKKEYRRLYNRWKKRQQRSVKKEYHPSFSREEVMVLKQASLRYNRPITTCIHDLCLAYLKQNFLVPDAQMIARIELLLAKAYDKIQYASDQLKHGNQRLGLLNMMRQVEQLEIELSSFLRQPEKLEDHLLKRASQDQDFRNRLIKNLTNTNL